MASYPHIVKVAWDVVAQFLIEWQRQPTLWQREIDVQTEIAGRLSAAYKLLGLYEVCVTAKNGETEVVPRVCCEPTVYYKWKGEKCWAYPDITVLGDPDTKSHNYGAKVSGALILWACEIKYDSRDSSGWDVAKLRSLIKQEQIGFGLWLQVHSSQDESVEAIYWEKEEKQFRLWNCEAYVPQREEI